MWCACALCQSNQRRPGAADHGRAFPALFPENFQGKDYHFDRTGRCLFVSRAAASPASTARTSNGVRRMCSWFRRGRPIRTAPTRKTVLFSISDRPMQEALGVTDARIARQRSDLKDNLSKRVAKRQLLSSMSPKPSVVSAQRRRASSNLPRFARCESGGFLQFQTHDTEYWVPAFAGTTQRSFLISVLDGTDR